MSFPSHLPYPCATGPHLSSTFSSHQQAPHKVLARIHHLLIPKTSSLTHTDFLCLRIPSYLVVAVTQFEVRNYMLEVSPRVSGTPSIWYAIGCICSPDMPSYQLLSQSVIQNLSLLYARYCSREDHVRWESHLGVGKKEQEIKQSGYLPLWYTAPNRV